ncbi:hypothetical protein M5689_005330 [Euphorbia peplus]|nr:hypothetical protein M5689_005330 [Euphorbia peplus]
MRSTGRTNIEAGQIPPSTRPNNPLNLTSTRIQTRTEKWQIQVVDYGLYDNNSINNECLIFLDEFKSEDKCGVLIRCKHVYHKFCIDQWLAIQEERCPGVEPSCPVCRAPVRTHTRANLNV